LGKQIPLHHPLEIAKKYVSIVENSQHTTEKWSICNGKKWKGKEEKALNIKKDRTRTPLSCHPFQQGFHHE
jgi:hypothetical protein